MDWQQMKWSNCQPSLSEEQLRHVEQILKVDFPSDYRDCVKHCHGGAPVPNRFSFEDPDIGTMESSLAILLSFAPNDPENVVDVYRRLSSFLPTAVIPFADDGGGDFLCFDFSQLGEPVISYWHHGEPEVVFLAESFSALLDRFY
jgi:hypothetical protein